MLTRIGILSGFVLLCSMMAAAGTVYENGQVDLNSGAWQFTGSRFWVSDTFTISSGNTTVNGLSIGVFLFITDHDPTIEVSISSQPNGGTVYFDQVLQFSESNCLANGWGYNICVETANWANGPNLPNGTYWVTLKNGSLPHSMFGLWNQNSGAGCHSTGCPSQAEFFPGTTIPSEAFTILGTPDGSSQSSPKTTSLLMFGAGFLGVVGIIRKKID
jgi:hypothetical protein